MVCSTFDQSFILKILLEYFFEMYWSENCLVVLHKVISTVLHKICCTTFKNEMSCWVLNIKCRKFVWFKEVLITLHMVSKHQTFYRIRNYNGFQIIGCLIDNQYYDLNAKNINQDYTSKLYCCGDVSWAFRHRKYCITIVPTILSIKNRKFICNQIRSIYRKRWLNSICLVS